MNETVPSWLAEKTKPSSEKLDRMCKFNADNKYKGPQSGQVIPWKNGRTATVLEVEEGPDSSNVYSEFTTFYTVYVSDHPLRLPGTKGGRGKKVGSLTLHDLVLQGYEVKDA